MGAIASQITSLTVVYSAIYSVADQSQHQSSASLAFVWGIHRGPVNSPHKWPVTRKTFPFDDVIIRFGTMRSEHHCKCLDRNVDEICSQASNQKYAFIDLGIGLASIERRTNDGPVHRHLFSKKIYISNEYAFENVVCEMAYSLSMGIRVKLHGHFQ